MWVCLAVFAATLTLYGSTMYPTVPGGDSGELLTTICTGGAAHPPGYPLFTLLYSAMDAVWRRAFPLLVGALPQSRAAAAGVEGAEEAEGTVASRANATTAVLGALAAAFLARAIMQFVELLRRPGGQKQPTHLGHMTDAATWTAVAGACMFALAPDVWLYSIQAEVFALNNCLCALVLAVLAQHLTAPSLRWASLEAFVCGLALCNQHTSVLFVLPVAVATMAAGMGGRGVSLWTPKALACLSLCALLGLAPYAHLPLAAIHNRLDSWGDQSTLDGFLHHFLRREYGTFQLASDVGEEQNWHKVMLRNWAFVERFRDHSFGIGPVLALIGIARCCCSVRLVVLPVCYLGYLAFLNTLSNLTFSALHMNITSRMWLQAHVAGYLLAALGLYTILDGADRMLGGEAVATAATTSTTRLETRSRPPPQPQPQPLGGEGAAEPGRRGRRRRKRGRAGGEGEAPTGERLSRVTTPQPTTPGEASAARDEGQGDDNGEGVACPSRRPRMLWAAVLAVGCAAYVHFALAGWYRDYDHSGDWTFHDYAVAVVDPLPADSLLLVNDDMNCNVLQYYLRCESPRTDIQFLRLPLITYTWWKPRQYHHFPGLKFPGNRHHPRAEGGFMMAHFLAENLGMDLRRGAPPDTRAISDIPRIYVAGDWKEGDDSQDVFQRIPVGLVHRVLPPATHGQERPVVDAAWLVDEASALFPASQSMAFNYSFNIGDWETVIMGKFHAYLVDTSHFIAERIGEVPPSHMRKALDLAVNLYRALRSLQRRHQELRDHVDPQIWRNAGVVAGMLAQSHQETGDQYGSAKPELMEWYKSRAHRATLDMFRFWKMFLEGAARASELVAAGDTSATGYVATPQAINEIEVLLRDGVNPYSQERVDPEIVRNL